MFKFNSYVPSSFVTVDTFEAAPVVEVAVTAIFAASSPVEVRIVQVTFPAPIITVPTSLTVNVAPDGLVT